MRSIVLFILLYGVGPTRVFAGPYFQGTTECIDGLGNLHRPLPLPAPKGPLPLSFEKLSADFKTRAESYSKVPFREEDMSFEWSATTSEDPTADSSRQLHLLYRGQEVCAADIYVKNRTMRFDIAVYPSFRLTGLYEYMLEQALRSHPSVKRIPAKLPYKDSTNAKFVIDELFGSTDKFVKWDVGSLSSEKLRMFREKAILTLAEMPGMKARRRTGFGKITKLVFYPKQETVSFEAVEGPSDFTLIKVYVDPRGLGLSVKEILPNGELSGATQSNLVLEDYPDPS